MSTDYAKQIKTYAVLGYTPTQIIEVLNLTSKLAKQVLYRIEQPDDEYNLAYRHGKALGQLAIDKELSSLANSGHAGAVAILDEKSKSVRYNELKKKLFDL